MFSSVSTFFVDTMYQLSSQQKISIAVSAQQVKAARALLNMSQTSLAKSAMLGLSTVVDFEKSRRRVSEVAVQAIRTALEARGIIFLGENGEGPGVRLRKRRGSKRSV
jgi:DNA-binding transcriptional regulator YiaG